MPAETQKTYKLADLIREVGEKKHTIVIETDNGEKFEIDPPELWDDAVFTTQGRGPVEEAKAIMGEDEYERFRAAGGRATLVAYVIEKQMQGLTSGESAAS